MLRNSMMDLGLCIWSVASAIYLAAARVMSDGALSPRPIWIAYRDVYENYWQPELI